MLMLWSTKERGGVELQLLGVNVLVVYVCELHKDINEWEREQSATGTRVGCRQAPLVAFWLSHALIIS
jgi:G:T-mismatch repair DNA endonuclease (very short patch repair protein)